MNEIAMHKTNLDLFWRFVYERHAIWHRRFVTKDPWPWTADPILLKNKFTNIYRELDPGTQFAKEMILEKMDTSPVRIFNIMIYRLICSIPTYTRLGWQNPFDFNYTQMIDTFEEITRSGEPVFGNAYLISPYSSMGSDTKYINVARLFREISKIFEIFFIHLKQAESFEQAFKVINGLYGFGPFLSFQVMVDLTYSLEVDGGISILRFSQNHWARCGPGAMKGINRLTHAPTPKMALEGLRWLYTNQGKEFDRLELRFPWWEDKEGIVQQISLANMQNCLCEFHKYCSIREGSGKAQRLFPSAGRP